MNGNKLVTIMKGRILLVRSLREMNRDKSCQERPQTGISGPSVAAAAPQMLLTEVILQYNATTNYCILMIMPWQTYRGHRRHLT